ncbi:MAG: fumarylacetoacetate hydrolase family protein [Candidatus Bipolaricaulota bacterium]|nr:fumarylacetoacetate hydrolase family protein [Candidatus Bipolaricaulota bacterium]MDW8151362.1 fumarylacetoacetate hydrolase family protein [Candidatus Bipolaricaulota bacterium]
MRIVRFGRGSWGVVEGEVVRVTRGPGGSFTRKRLPLAEVRLLPPTKPTKIVCVGRNYRRHAQEMGEEVPKEPGLFLKAPNALAAPGSILPYPSFTHSLHYEGELAVVVGKRMRRVSEDKALAYVLGYTCALDLTARDVQKTDLQWIRAKSADGFCPLGPWVETDVAPFDLRLRTFVNGEVRQDARTSAMIFSIPFLLAYVSSFMTLEPGDVLLTGTPEGVGELKPGDEVAVEIEGIGRLSVRVAPAS